MFLRPPANSQKIKKPPRSYAFTAKKISAGKLTTPGTTEDQAPQTVAMDSREKSTLDIMIAAAHAYGEERPSRQHACSNVVDFLSSGTVFPVVIVCEKSDTVTIKSLGAKWNRDTREYTVQDFATLLSCLALSTTRISSLTHAETGVVKTLLLAHTTVSPNAPQWFAHSSTRDTHTDTSLFPPAPSFANQSFAPLTPFSRCGACNALVTDQFTQCACDAYKLWRHEAEHV
jgi:hypothetical protein